MVRNSFTYDDDPTLRMLREVFPGVEVVTPSPERPTAWDPEEVRRSMEFCRSPEGVAAMERERKARDRRILLRERRARVDAAMREAGVPESRIHRFDERRPLEDADVRACRRARWDDR